MVREGKMMSECEGQSIQGELTVSIVYVLFLYFFFATLNCLAPEGMQ